MPEIGYEVDFLPVGENSKSGDAIAIRFGNLSGSRDEQAVIIIDGGFSEDGEKLAKHINDHYKTNKVDIVIGTHPHNDHIAGLNFILERMEVGEFWMHKPWDKSHINNISRFFSDGRVTNKSISDKLQKSLNSAKTLEELATDKKIPIIEPFLGLRRDFGFGSIDIVGPTKEYYEELLLLFGATPEPHKSIFEELFQMGKDFLKMIPGTWENETLTNDDGATPENNSSVISLIRVNEKKMLFTSDAGIPAITNVLDVLEFNGINHKNIDFVQVPHHGSKRNIGPEVLDRLVGSKLSKDQQDTRIKTVFCSCSQQGEPKHPSKKVTNAFKRRGGPVIVTKGKILCYSVNAPARVGYVSAVPLPFYSEVEDD